MIPLSRFRQNPYFARLFAFVLPFFWPVLWWSLNRLMRAYKAVGVEELLSTTNRWGLIRIVRLGDKRLDPLAYRRPDRIFRPLTDPSLESDLPAVIAASIRDERLVSKRASCGRPLAQSLDPPPGGFRPSIRPNPLSSRPSPG